MKVKKIIFLFASVFVLCSFISCGGNVHTESDHNHSWRKGTVRGHKRVFSCKVCGMARSEMLEPHDTVQVSGSKTINGKTWQLVTFGDAPQSVKTSSVTVDENDTIKMGAYEYCYGSDGEWYFKFPNYSSATDYKYYKVEPIKWRVLTKNYNNTGKILLFAERSLDGREFYPNSSIGGGAKLYDYNASQLRGMLNGVPYNYWTGDTKDNQFVNKGLLQTYFSLSAQNKICTTEVDNGPNSTRPHSDCLEESVTDDPNDVSKYHYATGTSNTKDKLFPLSLYEITNPEYGFLDDITADDARKDPFSDYMLARIKKNSYEYWLRTPGITKHANVRRVIYSLQSGYIEWGGEDANLWRGFRPAICIDSLE